MVKKYQAPPLVAMRFFKALLVAKVVMSKCQFHRHIGFWAGLCLLSLQCYLFGSTIYVRADFEEGGNGSYELPYNSINTAIQNLSSIEPNEVIILQNSPGEVSTFREQIVLDGLTQDLTIKSEYDPASGDLSNLPVRIVLPDVVDDHLAQSVVSITNCYNQDVLAWPRIRFQGLEIVGGKGTYNAGEGSTFGYRGGGFFIQSDGAANYGQDVEISYCRIHDNSATWGGGIFLRWGGLLLRNSEISNNYLSYSHQDIDGFFPYTPRGGGIYAHGASLTVLDTKFYDNRTFDSYSSECNWGNTPALWYEYDCLGNATPKCEVRNSLFYNNVSILHDYYEFEQNIEIPDIHSSAIVAQFTTHNSNHDVKFVNNTITDNTTFKEPTSTFERFTALGLNHYLTGFGELKNNIVWENLSGDVNNLDLVPRQIMGTYHPDGNPDNGTSLTPVFVTYSDINNAHNISYYDVPQGITLTDLHNIDQDPLFVCSEESDYNLRWDTQAISPCIDAGYSEDEDGTPADIGALSAVQHQYWEYSFENQHDVDRWHWVSYPILNTITDNALIASEFFKELLVVHPDFYGNDTPIYLDTISWITGPEQYQDNIYWDNIEYDWTPIQNSHIVSSPQGYKIKLQSRLNPEFPWPVTLVESGFKTPNNTQFPIYGEVENWLGYFREEPQYPEDAFADIWDDLVSVRAKNWSIARDESTGLMIGKKGTLNFGDMVIVRTNNDHNTFQWGGNHPVPPDLKPEVKGFVYDEKPDYIPLYVSLSDSLLQDLDEIGLYVDGVCRGAVVVEDSLEQISAYVDNAAELSEGNVEFVFCYNDSKSMEPQMKSMKLPVGRLKAKYSQAGSAYPYFELKLSQEEMGNVVPPEFTLRQNYPNPFNPTTTIAYSLPTAGKVRLDIYNVKGQLVNTLVNQDMEAGLHSIIWNGRDMNNQSVASGIYFYRLSSPSMTQTKRMLLMK